MTDSDMAPDVFYERVSQQVKRGLDNGVAADLLISGEMRALLIVEGLTNAQIETLTEVARARRGLTVRIQADIEERA